MDFPEQSSFQLSQFPTLNNIENTKLHDSFQPRDLYDINCFCGLSSEYQKLKSKNILLKQQYKALCSQPPKFSKQPIDRQIEAEKSRNKQLKQRSRNRNYFDMTSINISHINHVQDEGVYVRQLESINQKLQHENKALSNRLNNRLRVHQ